MRLFNDGWSFLKTEFGTEFEDVKGRFNEFADVDIPHDWLIYHTSDLYETSTGWYKKSVEYSAPFCEKTGRAVLVFDGVYMDCTLYVNGTKIGDWKYGYSTFSFDVTDALKEGENEIVMQVRHQSPNSRWYSGAGIYRNVYLHVYPKAYLPLDGTYFHTKKLDDDTYQVEITTECEGTLSEGMQVHYSLCSKGETVDDLGNGKCNEAFQTTVSLSESGICEWSLRNPNCYTLLVELVDEQGVCVDSQEINVGFKDMVFTPEDGLILNGEKVKIHGVCEHHDFGCLGSVFHKEAMRRKFTILRQMGVNGLRTSHNMPAREVMELADEMGFLVLSEAFDMWERSKTDYDYARFFKDWAKEDVRSWVRRDRNHPSLLMWSIGNEIYDTHADAHGEEITRRLFSYVREHDKKGNAPVTIGSNYMAWEGARNCADIVKFAGYNYGEKYYEEHHKKHPDWVIYGSETASTVQSRGVYKFPLEQPLLSDDDEQCSSLGNSRTSWGARSTEGCIIDDRDAEFAFGQFIWTGFDYIGEPTPYHTKNSYFGQIDTAGFPKDSFYIYQAEWTDGKEAPMVHVFPYWNFNEGQIVDVRACTNGSSVELFVNGVSQGRKEIDHKKGETLVPTFSVPFVPGEITAVAYDENGQEIARETRKTFSDGVSLRLTCDKSSLRSDGEDLAFFTIEALDADGNVVENASDYVELTVSGQGRLLGMDNGDSTDSDAYKTNVRRMFNGKLLAVVASDTNAGEVTVTARAKHLKETALSIPVCPAECRGGISASENLSGRESLESKEDIPRQIVLKVTGNTKLTKECPSMELSAEVYPTYAKYKALHFRVVNAAGIEMKSVTLTRLSETSVRLTAMGDGDYYVRCLAETEDGNIRTISQLEFEAVGMGMAFTNPYELVIAGLYTKAVGNIGNGNDRGVATEWDEPSGPVFENVDFGDFGSDEITIPVFAFSDSPVKIEIWNGVPNEEGAELLLNATYSKPTIWNVYQEETYKLPRRLKGVQTISFLLREKVHIKGFWFTKQSRAFSYLNAAECDQIYGDSFEKKEKEITGIGNNVTISYENMDFGAEGAASITLFSRSTLDANTVHIHFLKENGEMEARILEVKGNTKEYIEQTIALEPLCGAGKLEFIFLPGTKLDLLAFWFGEKAK